MFTREIRFTRGDKMTLPGGIIIRERAEEPRFVVHHFDRDWGSKVPIGYFWGSYCATYAEACDVFDSIIERARRYNAGGSLIPKLHESQIEREVEL